MKQIYINTMLGTIRINWDETLPGDVIISATHIGSILSVQQDHIEATGIDPLDMETHEAEQAYCIVNKANKVGKHPFEVWPSWFLDVCA